MKKIEEEIQKAAQAYNEAEYIREKVYRIKEHVDLRINAFIAGAKWALKTKKSIGSGKNEWQVNP